MSSEDLQGEDLANEPSPLPSAFRNIPAFTGGFLQPLENPVLEGRPSRPGIELQVEAADLARIPAAGPVLVVCNHALGMVDGSLLANLLRRVRPDVKVLSPFPQVNQLSGQHIFMKSPRRALIGSDTLKLERQGELEALAWLNTGRMLALFPAESTSHWQFPQAQIADPLWRDLPVRLLRRSRATALPVFLCCQNLSLKLLANLHPRFRRPFPLQEWLQQEGHKVEIRVATEIPAASLAGIADDREATEYLRWRTYLLERRGRPEKSWPIVMRSKVSAKVQKPVALAGEAQILSEELSGLAVDRTLIESGDLVAYLAKAGEVPRLLLELGRLREITFRGAGEGTGKSRDLDRFDRYYWHILLWNKSKKELVGAYRAGNTAEILAERGVKALYTSTLFRYNAKVFEKLGPALELGRSFVRPEYQRQYAPLLLLWKAVARLLATQPQIAVVFGPVSISNDYCKASREMIYRFFEARMQGDELAGLIAPRKPFRPAGLCPWESRAMRHWLHDLEALSQPITDVEIDGKGLPILLRQYARIGGKFLSFNVDRKFSNALDGFVVVDLRKTEPAVLERYMGRDAATRFRRQHGLEA